MLLGLLVVGALVRFWGVGYGLPPVDEPSEVRFWGSSHWLPHSYHPDEAYIVNRAVRFHGGDLNPRFFNWPSLYMYLLSAFYGLVFGAWGVLDTFARNPVPFYLLGRMVTATFGTATIGVLYVIAAELYGTTTAVLASLFLAVNLLHIRDSHYITTDVPLTCLVMVAMLLVVRYSRQGRFRDALLGGLFTGLAASMKYPGGLMLLPLVLAHVLRPNPAHRPLWRRVLGREVVVGGLLAAVGFVAGTPYALLTPRAFWHGVTSEIREVGTVQFGNEGDLPGYLFHMVHSLPEGMGLPVSLLALAGLLIAVLGGGRREVILLAFPLPYYLVIGTWSSRFERYTLPLMPFLAVLAALCLVVLAGTVRRHAPALVGHWRPGLGLAVAAGLVVLPEAARIGYFHVLLTRPDTRELATAWIEREIPSGSRIVMEPYSPALNLSREMVREERRRLAESGAASVLTVRYDRFLASPGPDQEPSYWITRLTHYNLDRLVEQRAEYVVLSSFMYERYQRACHRRPVPCRFYEDLARRGTLVHTVEPGSDAHPLWVGDIYSPLTRLFDRTRPGPRIKIYRLPSA